MWARRQGDSTSSGQRSCINYDIVLADMCWPGGLGTRLSRRSCQLEYDAVIQLIITTVTPMSASPPDCTVMH